MIYKNKRAPPLVSHIPGELESATRGNALSRMTGGCDTLQNCTLLDDGYRYLAAAGGGGGAAIFGASHVFSAQPRAELASAYSRSLPATP